MKKVYYATSAHSHNDSIIFVIKFDSQDSFSGPRIDTRNEFIYEQFANWKWDDIYLFHTKTGIKAYEDHYQSKGKTDHNLLFEPT